MTLPSALDFTTLPSERGQSPARRLLAQLAKRAYDDGIGNWLNRGSVARRELRRLRDRSRIGDPADRLSYFTQPGAFLEKHCSAVDRRILRSLTSDDVRELDIDTICLVAAWWD